MTTFDDLVEKRLAGGKVSSADLAKMRAAADLASLDAVVAEEESRRHRLAQQVAAQQVAYEVAESWGTAKAEIIRALQADVDRIIDQALTALTNASAPVHAAVSAWDAAGLNEPGHPVSPLLGGAPPARGPIADVLENRARGLRNGPSIIG